MDTILRLLGRPLFIAGRVCSLVAELRIRRTEHDLQVEYSLFNNPLAG
jgi:hypothetical protein